MDNNYNKTITKITYILAIAVVLAIVYFIFAKPYFTFRSYEKKMEEAGKKYFEINAAKLPTGNRVGYITLRELTANKYLKETFTVPLSSKLCSLNESWVKVKLEGSDYKYYVYLECGYLESKVDHEGPVIKLNGDQEMTLTKFEKYEEPGIKSIIDKNDGKISEKEAAITGEVNTSRTGVYEVKYTVSDSLDNETKVVRKINVIDTVTSITKRETDRGFYPGESTNNYIRFNNQLYRIIGIENNNVKIISDEIVGVVNYEALEKQLDNYYESLSSKSKKLIVKSKFCKDNLSNKNLDTTECSSTTEEKSIYIPSVTDINRVKTSERNYMLTQSVVWTSNQAKENYAYIASDSLPTDNGFETRILATNAGLRPMFMIKGDLIVSEGSGKEEDPYIIEKDVKPGKAGDMIEDRYAGEYIDLDSGEWRITKQEKDGTTKIIFTDIISIEGQVIQYNDDGNDQYEYNPKKAGTYAYYINNKLNSYISTEGLVSHEITVPIYEKDVLYGKETKKEKYKVKLSAPNIYDLYSTGVISEYIAINTSLDRSKFAFFSANGNVVNRSYDSRLKYAVKPVAFIKSDMQITEGTGTKQDPYSLK